MSLDTPLTPDDDNKLITERREKLGQLRLQARAAGAAVFPNDFKPRHHAAELQTQYGALDNEALEPQGVQVAVAGRIMLKRIMGKASFATLQDGSFGPKGSENHGRIQLFVRHLAVAVVQSGGLVARLEVVGEGDARGAQCGQFLAALGDELVVVGGRGRRGGGRGVGVGHRAGRSEGADFRRRS